MEDQSDRVSHRQEAASRLTPLGQRLFKYVEFDADEQLVAEIRKHPIGILAISLLGAVVSLIMLGGAFIVASNLDVLGVSGVEGPNSVKAIIVSAGVLLALLSIFVTGIAIVLYRLNVVFVTNEKIAEVAYASLFNRKATQLNIGRVEDVTVTQRGIFAYTFGYGTLLVETAGEKENASFTLVPQPHLHSQQIIEAHEKYVEKFGN